MLDIDIHGRGVHIGSSNRYHVLWRNKLADKQWVYTICTVLRPWRGHIERLTSTKMTQHLSVTLGGAENDTYHGMVEWRKLSELLGDVNKNVTDANDDGLDHPDDPWGAGYYVMAVILVYGMSITLLIASHIKKKHNRLVEDKQIHKYLHEFQVVKDTASRDSYRNLKKSIMHKLNMNHRHPVYGTLSQAVLPMMAVGMPRATLKVGHDADDVLSSGSECHSSLLASAFLPVRTHRNGRGRELSALDISQEYDLAIREVDTPHSDQNSDDNSSLEDTNRYTLDTRDSQARLIDGGDAMKDRCYYKPISISPACRVYEVPSSPPARFIKPGGIHVMLHKPIPTRAKPSTTRSPRSDVFIPIKQCANGVTVGVIQESPPPKRHQQVLDYNSNNGIEQSTMTSGDGSDIHHQQRSNNTTPERDHQTEYNLNDTMLNKDADTRSQRSCEVSCNGDLEEPHQGVGVGLLNINQTAPRRSRSSSLHESHISDVRHQVTCV